LVEAMTQTLVARTKKHKPTRYGRLENGSPFFL